jgi:hypothetical protein
MQVRRMKRVSHVARTVDGLASHHGHTEAGQYVPALQGPLPRVGRCIPPPRQRYYQEPFFRDFP